MDGIQVRARGSSVHPPTHPSIHPSTRGISFSLLLTTCNGAAQLAAARGDAAHRILRHRSLGAEPRSRAPQPTATRTRTHESYSLTTRGCDIMGSQSWPHNFLRQNRLGDYRNDHLGSVYGCLDCLARDLHSFARGGWECFICEMISLRVAESSIHQSSTVPCHCTVSLAFLFWSARFVLLK